MVRLFKIELCTEDTSGERVLAKEYLSINEISNYHRDEPFLPTYGPSFIDLYSEPNNLRIKKILKDSNEDDEDFGLLKTNSKMNLNRNQEDEGLKENDRIYMPLGGNGSFYVARMFLSISSKKISQHSELKESMKKSFKRIDIKQKPQLSEFMAFCLINECTMIDSRYQNGELSFQLCVGNL